MNASDHILKWEELTLNAPFAPRDGAGLLSFKDRLWLLGGWNPKDKTNFPNVCNSEVWSSVDGLKWTHVAALSPWEGRHTAGYAVHRNKMWIIGGDCNQGHYQPDVWCSEDGVSWDLVCDDTPWGKRALHYTVAFKDKLWVMGGQTMPGFVPSETKDVKYNDVWCSEDGKQWQKISENAPWSPRGMIGGSAVFMDRMWIIGGGTYDTPSQPVRKRFNDVWSSEDGIHWECHIQNAPWYPRMYHEITASSSYLWLLEGFGFESSDNLAKGANRNDVWYSSDGKNWHEFLGTPWSPRHAASVTMHNRQLYIITGNNMESDVWRLY